MGFEVFSGDGKSCGKFDEYNDALPIAKRIGGEVRDASGRCVKLFVRRGRKRDESVEVVDGVILGGDLEPETPVREGEPEGPELDAHQPDNHVDPPEADQPEVEYFAGNSTVRFEREVITPELAAKWLDNRAPNRTPSSERVNSYASDMLAGRWADTHQPVALGPSNELVDGEHRLRAIVKANIPVAMWVARGVPLDNRWAIDQGRARSVGDALRINDGLKHGPKLAKWFRIIESMACDWKAMRVVSPARVRELAAKYPESVEWAIAKAPRSRSVGRAPIVAALIYAHRVMPELVEAFGQKYSTGEQLVAGDPAYALRQSVLNGVATRETDRTYVLRTFRCLLGEHRGERIERVGASEEAFAFFRALHTERDGAR